MWPESLVRNWVDFPNNEYVVSLRVVNDAVVSGAPVRVANLTAEFVGGELAGEYIVYPSRKDCRGRFLNGNVEYTVSVNGKEHSERGPAHLVTIFRSILPFRRAWPISR